MILDTNKIKDLVVKMEVDNANYDVDLYVIVEETGEISFDTFANPGGNSWINNHNYYCVYTHTYNYDMDLEEFNNSKEEYRMFLECDSDWVNYTVDTIAEKIKDILIDKYDIDFIDIDII